ncbi:IclR family transcriptional regulator [Bacillus sp. FJAT-45350]|uniref:IclR family transcriptional regulator n=1 Tax=Bacillus sp. FJAT-45350 TaxID=2011014 RepID=UPI000BB7317C|nr:IclR family transcriptional regulator [Bacillus sp. FJAT-45350]
MNKNNSAVSEKTLKLLMLFSVYKELSVSEMANLIEINISSAYRIVNTLRELGFIEQRDNKCYVLCSGNILRLYRMINKEIRDIARPVINELVTKYNESVYLSEVYEDEKVIIIEKKDSTSHLKWSENIGTVYHMPTGTAGKTHLAYFLESMEVNKQEAYLKKLKLKRYTENSITNIKELKKSIKEILEQGYCITESEHVNGVVGVSVPVFDFNNECKAVLTMVMASSRYDKNNKENYINGLLDAARKIGSNLTY